MPTLPNRGGQPANQNARKDEDKKRNQSIYIRVTDDERAQILEALEILQKTNRITMARWCRNLLLNAARLVLATQKSNPNHP